MSNPTFRAGSEDEWTDLLRQLRLQGKAQPKPFFYARVHARLVAGRGPALAWLPAWVRRPAYAALLGALVLAVSGDGSTPRSAAPASQYDGYHLSQPPLVAPH